MNGFGSTNEEVFKESEEQWWEQNTPCGTPLLTVCGGDTEPFTITEKDLFER